MRIFAFNFLFFTFLLPTVSVFSNDTITNRFSAIAEQVDRNALSHAKIAKKYVSELQHIAEKHPDNISFTVEMLYREATVNYYQLINDSSLLMKCKFVGHTLSANQYPFEIAVLNYSLAMCYSVNGDFATAFTYALKSLEEFKKFENQSFTCKLYCILGNILFITKSKDEAMECYRKAISLAVPGERDYYLPFIAMYSNLAYDENYKQIGIDTLEHFLSHPEHCSDKGLLLTASFNLGSIYYTLGDEVKGAEKYNLCKQYIDVYEIDNHMLQFGLIYNLSEYYFDKGKFQEALNCIAPAKEIAMNNHNLMQQSYILLLISKIYENLNHLDSAYFYLIQYKEVREQIINNSRIIDSYKAYITVYLESLEKELTIAAQAKKQFLIVIIFVSVIFLLMLRLLLALLQRRRRMFLQIEKDKLIKRLQEDKIESQKRELTSSVLLLSRKNELLEQIDEHVKSLPQNNYDVKSIKQIVKGNLTVEEVWGTFMLHFDKVHPDFFDKLKAHTPTLTENNLRFCAYLLIGMSAKQIAQVLNMSPDNVRKSSYRLKKKLSLGEQESLYDFLRTV
jgi:tetratricopeptide (TPR) repeat protein